LTRASIETKRRAKARVFVFDEFASDKTRTKRIPNESKLSS
jgi:hypothetical protein